MKYTAYVSNAQGSTNISHYSFQVEIHIYIIVSGLYTESHGIIANAMYDPVLDDYFTTRNGETRWWNGGEPIWITAVKAGLTSGRHGAIGFS